MMRAGWLGACLVLAACAAETEAAETEAAETADWRDVTCHCGFSFRAPPDYEQGSTWSIDACGLNFHAAGCDYSADYGMYSGDFSTAASEPSYRSQEVVVDGREATLVRLSGRDGAPRLYIAGIHIEQIDPEQVGIKLTITALCETGQDAGTAERVFRSLRF